MLPLRFPMLLRNFSVLLPAFYEAFSYEELEDLKRDIVATRRHSRRAEQKRTDFPSFLFLYLRPVLRIKNCLAVTRDEYRCQPVVVHLVEKIVISSFMASSYYIVIKFFAV